MKNHFIALPPLPALKRSWRGTVSSGDDPEPRVYGCLSVIKKLPAGSFSITLVSRVGTIVGSQCC